MKVFIICSFKLAVFYKTVREAVEEMGHILSYDWLRETEERKREDWSQEQRNFMEKEEAGIRNADLCFLLLPCGNDSLVELGMALAQSKKVIVLGHPQDYPDVSRFNHPLIHRFECVGMVLPDKIAMNKESIVWSIIQTM